jgi:hypothetical protein
MDKVGGILLIYHHPLRSDAATIMEHVNAFGQNSRFRVWTINTALGFPRALGRLRFSAVILHYSLFGWHPFSLHKPFIEYVEKSKESYKIAFFQDEYRYWPERVNLLNTLSVDCVYTLVEPQHFADTYCKRTHVPKLVYNLPAYISEDAVAIGKRAFKPDKERIIDIGYRGRQPPFYLGKGAQEKHLIGIEFLKRASSLGLRLDIETDEKKRIYGKGWISFLANCRSVLGVEAGTTVFDIDNLVRPQYEKMCRGNPDVIFPNLRFEEVHDAILAPHEDKIYYRTISARHFEAAALRVSQILFEGKYSGILKPMIHYIPLKKDFSNFDEVIKMFKDSEFRREITRNAYDDLIASDNYSYKVLISGLDRELLDVGIRPNIDASEDRKVTHLLKRSVVRHFLGYWVLVRHSEFPGRDIIKPLAKPLLKKLGI